MTSAGDKTWIRCHSEGFWKDLSRLEPTGRGKTFKPRTTVSSSFISQLTGTYDSQTIRGEMTSNLVLGVRATVLVTMVTSVLILSDVAVGTW